VSDFVDYLVNEVKAIRKRVTALERLQAIDTGATGAYYLGNSSTDGSWRITRSGNNLVIQRREAGDWVTKDTVAA
jgi:hypothetical protein